MVSELILSNHAKKFINPKHTFKAARGVLFDGDGFGYATDSIQALKVGGMVPVGFPWIQGLNGKPIEEDPSRLEIIQDLFDKELDIEATVNMKDLLDAADLLHSVQKVDLIGRKKKLRDLMEIKLVAENGILSIRYDTPMACEFVSGSVAIGTSDKDCSVSVNCVRLLDCLKVFEKDFETINILIGSSLIRFEAEGVAVALLTFN